MKKASVYTFLFYAGLLFGLGACAKDESTRPAPVSLQMELSSGNVDIGARTTAKNTIRVESAQYRISEMAFEGYRESGRDYFFTKDFGDGLSVEVKAGASANVFSFDMPQGVYERIGISLQLHRSNGKSDAMAYNEDAAIIMRGFYLNNKEEEIPLIFVYDFDETLSHTARHAAGSTDVAVRQDHGNVASIVVDLSYWLQLINGRMLQGARLTTIDGQPTIIISEDQNENIFNLLTTRIKDATKLTFR